MKKRSNIVPFRTTRKHLQRLQDRYLSEKQRQLKNRFIWCYICVDKEFPLTVDSTGFTVINGWFDMQEEG